MAARSGALAHWKDHQKICHSRRHLARAISIFDELWTAFEESTFESTVEYVGQQNGIISLNHPGPATLKTSKAACVDIKEVGINPKNPALLVNIPGDDPYVHHVILRVTTPSGERFAVDLAGAQYGWQERLYAWEMCWKYRVESGGDVASFGSAKRSENAMYSMIDQDGPAAAGSVIRKAIVAGMAAEINAFCVSQNMGMKKFLSQPEAEFVVAREQLVT
ncbi:Fc.00g011640.m01.CDS01 [Cosmosporella sp. VM-42]